MSFPVIWLASGLQTISLRKWRFCHNLACLFFKCLIWCSRSPILKKVLIEVNFLVKPHDLSERSCFVWLLWRFNAFQSHSNVCRSLICWWSIKNLWLSMVTMVIMKIAKNFMLAKTFAYSMHLQPSLVDCLPKVMSLKKKSWVCWNWLWAC